MPVQSLRTGSRLRTLFVSDVHLGSRNTRAPEFLAFLESVQPERIYIVGDFIDGWRLKRRWRWHAVYIRILQRLVELASQGTLVHYAPGNHDEFLRDYLHDFGLIKVADQFIHRTMDGRRFVVLHGDQFDAVENRARWLSVVGAMGYEGLVTANRLVNWVRRQCQMEDCRFSSQMKIWAKHAVQFISDFEERLVCHAKELECQGVICGHIHVPRIDRFGDVTYCNTGDWVEHCSALIEHETGQLELVEWTERTAVLQHRERQWPLAVPSVVEPVAGVFAASVVSPLAELNQTLEVTRHADVADLFHSTS